MNSHWHCSLQHLVALASLADTAFVADMASVLAIEVDPVHTEVDRNSGWGVDHKTGHRAESSLGHDSADSSAPGTTWRICF